MSIFLERLQQYAKAKNLSFRSISLSAGQSASYLSNSLKQGATPSVEVVSNIIDKYPDLNPNWLLTGKGVMVLEENLMSSSGEILGQNKSIDQLIDEKIDDKLSTFTKTLRELIANEIDMELKAATKSLKKAQG